MMRKRILAGVVLGLLWLAAAVVVLTLPGCASSPRDHSAATQLVVNYAAMKFIEQAPPQARSDRARAVIDIAAELETAARGEEITLQRLAQIALERIPVDLPASDRMLAVSLVNVLQQELSARIGHGGLQSDSLLVLAELLAWVRESAAFYVVDT